MLEPVTRASLPKQRRPLISSKDCGANGALIQYKTSYTWCSFSLKERRLVQSSQPSVSHFCPVSLRLRKRWFPRSEPRERLELPPS